MQKIKSGLEIYDTLSEIFKNKTIPINMHEHIGINIVKFIDNDWDHNDKELSKNIIKAFELEKQERNCIVSKEISENSRNSESQDEVSCFQVEIDHKFNSDDEDFAMAFFKLRDKENRDKGNGDKENWVEYFEKYGKIEFTICSNYNISGLSFQLKTKEYEGKPKCIPDCIDKYINLDNGPKFISIPLTFGYKKDDLKNMDEICFTVYKHYVRDYPARLFISNLRVVYDDLY